MPEKQFLILCRRGLEIKRISANGRGEKKKKKKEKEKEGFLIINIIRKRPWI
ncbi:hypothetical protein JW698_02035 [Candidatus Wolfebacteria bacterium]|nr:hypothetical protein [Candidatus Wolfebacteria bacterium]